MLFRSGLYVGRIGLFLALLFLFIRFLPMISIFEMRTLVPAGEGATIEGASVEGKAAEREKEDA